MLTRTLIAVVFSGLLAVGCGEEGIVGSAAETTEYRSLQDGDAEGLLILPKAQHEGEVHIPLDVPRSALGLFADPPVFDWTGWYGDSTRSWTVKPCFVRQIEEDDGLHSRMITVDEEEELGLPLMMLIGVDLPVGATVETLFSGGHRLITLDQQRDDWAFVWHEFEVSGDAGRVVVYPDTGGVEEARVKGGPSGHDHARLFARSGDRKSLLSLSVGLGESAGPTVCWAGDIDQDGIPDLVMDLGHYNVTDYYLFLSTLAGEGEVYGLAGRLRSVGC